MKSFQKFCLVALAAVAGSLLQVEVSAFIANGSNIRTHQRLQMAVNENEGDIFEAFRKFWNFGANNEQPTSEESVDEDEPAGTTLIASIPVKSIKPGGLRLFLMFYFMGMQNTPDPRSWQANQPQTSTEEGDENSYLIEMYFHDATGMISVDLGSEQIRITRCGSVPSTAYLMQESVIVQGILDELDQCAFDESVQPEDRLLLTATEDAIDMARGSISFG